MLLFIKKTGTAFALMALLMMPTLDAAAVDEPPLLDTTVDTRISAPPATTPDSSEPVPESAPVPASEANLLALIKKGGVVGYLIIILSVIALGLVINNFYTIRRSRIMPSRDLDTLRELISANELDKATSLETKQSSFVLRVTVAGLRDAHLGYGTMIKSMEDTSEALASAIARKTEHLNVIGSISPMIGLLGTVIGMLQVFNEIAVTPGAIEPRQLAEGIFQALVTTCLGLTVAIPSLYAYAIIRNRVDEFTGEAALEAEHLISSFKKIEA